MKYSEAQKLEIVMAANASMVGRLYDWPDFVRYVHDHHGISGLAATTLYKALKQSGLVDLELGRQVRKRGAT
jgi:hypothetical protein